MISNAVNFNRQKIAEMNALCCPLERSFNFGLIHYRRFYYEGGMLSLFNHADWMNYSYENSFIYSTVLYQKLKHLQNKNNHIYLWPLEPLKDAVYQGLYNHNLWNGITIYKKQSDYIESFAFATSKENIQMGSMYLSELEILEHFILYFKTNFLHLIPKSVEKDILLPFSYVSPAESQEDFIKKQFMCDTQINNFYLNAKGIDIKITKREYQCLSYLAVGKRPKEIANILDLSVRTVESFVSNIKHKANVFCTSELISLFHQNNW